MGQSARAVPWLRAPRPACPARRGRGGGVGGSQFHLSSPHKRENGTNGIPGVTPPNSIFEGVGMGGGKPLAPRNTVGKVPPSEFGSWPKLWQTKETLPGCILHYIMSPAAPPRRKKQGNKSSTTAQTRQKHRGALDARRVPVHFHGGEDQVNGSQAGNEGPQFQVSRPAA